MKGINLSFLFDNSKSVTKGVNSFRSTTAMDGNKAVRKKIAKTR